jgi:hypothetical protein
MATKLSDPSREIEDEPSDEIRDCEGSRALDAEVEHSREFVPWSFLEVFKQ